MRWQKNNDKNEEQENALNVLSQLSINLEQAHASALIHTCSPRRVPSEHYIVVQASQSIRKWVCICASGKRERARIWSCKRVLEDRT